MNDWAYEEACREVDALTPSGPPIAKSPVPLNFAQVDMLVCSRPRANVVIRASFDSCPPAALLPPGTWRDETTDDFVVPGVGRVPLRLWRIDRAAFMRATGFVPR